MFILSCTSAVNKVCLVYSAKLMTLKSNFRHNFILNASTAKIIKHSTAKSNSLWKMVTG